MKKTICVFALAGASLGVAPQSLAEVALKAVTALPKQVIYTQDALRFLEKVNEAGKGVVRVNWIGGPEVVPPTEQAQALRNGVVDIVISPANYHWGVVPESAAIAGTNKTPWELRKNGAVALLSGHYQKRLNAHYLGWLSANVGFNIYLRQAPRITATGMPDLKGVKLRSNPVYQDFFAQLGATNITIQTPEVYAALERGTVDGVGWPEIGVADFNWDKFLRYRLDPPFYRSDVVILVNLGTWTKLTAQARDLLEKIMARYERESFDFFEAEKKRDDDKMRKRGMKIVSVGGKKSDPYLRSAYDQIWARIAKQAPAAAPALKEKFYR